MNSARPPDNQLPRAGDIVAGKYRVESIIGQGGMGVVLGATDTSLGRRVAIKFLAPHKARNEGTAARFVREARAAASIQSEHVVRVFEVSTLPNGASYIVMEHLAGGDLSQILAQRGPLPIEEAADYLLQACEAIAEAHGRGIVHRDLKPQNLFVTHLNDGTPTVKVLDFGISKAIDEAAPNLTATDTVMGTPLYMSPEQVRSLKNVDLRSDIWALGAILFELLTAAPIYEAATATALCAMIAMDPPTPLRAKRPSAPPELEALILRCLHKDPSGRFQDVGAFAEALANYATERGRLSASRIVRLVRGNNPQAAGAMGAMGAMGGGVNAYAATGGGMTGGGMTGGGMTGYPSQIPGAPGSAPQLGGGYAGSAGSNYPPGAFAPGHAYPMGPPRTTQRTWQHQTGAMGTGTIEQRRSGSVLFALLGVVAGIFVLVLVGGAIVYVLNQRGTDGASATKADGDAGAAAAGAVAVGGVAAGAPAGTAGAATPGGPAPPGVATTVRRVDPKAAGKDAGAAPGVAVAPGAPAAPGAAPAAPAGPTPDELAAKKRTAEGFCGLHRSNLSRNQAPANVEATRVKNSVCLQASSLSPNSGAANCHRAVCRQACAILNDQQCLRNVDFADRGNPLPF